MPHSPFTDRHPLIDQLHHFIAKPLFPCVGAKSALAKGQIKAVVARSIASAWNDLAIHAALMRFAGGYARDRKLFQSLAVIFEGPRTLDERVFEKNMWSRLQSMSDKDKWLGQPYDQAVSPDPANPHFSLSFAGHAFFVVGLHPRASRKARRFVAPTMIFNLHDQFERLRAQGRYEKLRDAILDRDEDYSGTLNPMLSRHGEHSEARQYSGRAVGDDWRCPFSHAA
ncbi:MAG: YqcI/YcgG family protein [Sphingomonadaceae bacterium]|nr:YqcI/YcgG family protein [Sphingomonadaceae bacterium]